MNPKLNMTLDDIIHKKTKKTFFAKKKFNNHRESQNFRGRKFHSKNSSRGGRNVIGNRREIGVQVSIIKYYNFPIGQTCKDESLVE